MTSPERRAALAEYLRVLRDVMRLQAWNIDVSEKPVTDEKVILETAPHEARHTATVGVGTFFALDAADQREACVHELIHLVQAHLWEWVDDDQPWHDRIAADLRADVRQRIQYELELHADFLARLIAPSMPLPPGWPDAS